jgi:hypothetical protein
MPEIVDLLEKLKQLDSATHENIAKWGLNWNHPDESALSEYIVQGEVQRAIATRGWYFTIERYHKTYFIKIIIPYECAVDETFRCNSGTLCDALLTCYIACLESQP